MFQHSLYFWAGIADFAATDNVNLLVGQRVTETRTGRRTLGKTPHNSALEFHLKEKTKLQNVFFLVFTIICCLLCFLLFSFRIFIRSLIPLFFRSFVHFIYLFRFFLCLAVRVLHVLRVLHIFVSFASFCLFCPSYPSCPPVLHVLHVLRFLYVFVVLLFICLTVHLFVILSVFLPGDASPRFSLLHSACICLFVYVSLLCCLCRVSKCLPLRRLHLKAHWLIDDVLW